MGRIKSALEIALERTESIKGDLNSISLFVARQQGKKVANEFLEGSVETLKDEINQALDDSRDSLKQGMFDVLLSQIALPLTAEDQKWVERAGRGLAELIGGSRFGALLKQFSQVLSQYREESAQYEEAIKRQYAPKLRQKEEELSRRLGRPVQIDPFQDPEFAAFYNQNMKQLKSGYQAAADQMREEAVKLFNEKK
jgi:dGTP triphosphohydrolase